jgi:polysaccharide export outer membrane protein
MGTLLAVCAAGAGCHSTALDPRLCATQIPRELQKVNMPTYRVEPPDILTIDALTVVPRPPYHAQPLDVLLIQVPGTFAVDPIYGPHQVSPEGTVLLGLQGSWGPIRVAGLTLEEIRQTIEQYLKEQKKVKEPATVVTLGQSRALTQIRGEHLVRPDGTVYLGTYGDVRVTGMTLAEAKAAIEAHLSQYLLNPEISVDVLSYNSKIIYLIVDGGGAGQTLTRMPVTGNETVLDIMSKAGGLSAISSKKRIWIARPAPTCAACDQILPVDWDSITMRGRTESNYQLLPGDRLYVDAQPLLAFNTFMTKLTNPLQTITGPALLGRGVVATFATPLITTGVNGNVNNAVLP